MCASRVWARLLGLERATVTGVVFKSIVAIHLRRLGNRLADRRLLLDVTGAAREWLAVSGFDPVYGARPLRRLIQTAIGDQLARALLAGEVRDGDTVRVDLDESKDTLAVTPSHKSLT